MSGLTAASFSGDGTQPEVRDKFIIFVMVGSRKSRHLRRRTVGMGSRGLVVFFDDERLTSR
jgi:hypothetical protein